MFVSNKLTFSTTRNLSALISLTHLYNLCGKTCFPTPEQTPSSTPSSPLQSDSGTSSHPRRPALAPSPPLVRDARPFLNQGVVHKSAVFQTKVYLVRVHLTPGATLRILSNFHNPRFKIVHNAMYLQPFSQARKLEACDRHAKVFQSAVAVTS